ncbi:flavin reductase family protein [Kribbella deserti]|uniref:Flavin reductase family protein n=1 Tax=Kribbella deserti TaxID=1926257 RepID=A0ABV6QN44_9ACTN
MKRVIEPKVLYFGTPVILVSSLNGDGSTNLAPMSSAWWLGDSAMLGLSANSQTVRNLERHPDCVLNLTDKSLVAAVDRIALLTGRRDVPAYKEERGYRYEADKFAAAGLTSIPCDLVTPQAVAESPIHLEGRVRAIHQIDAADSMLRALEVTILRTHVDPELVMAHKEHYIDPLRWDPLIMKFTEYFAGGTVAQPSSLARGWGMPPLPPEALQGERAS